MHIAKFLIEAGKALVELGDHFFMQDARLDSLGARREPPKDAGEITDQIREAILVSRAETSDDDWLRTNGRRDQECVRYGITREQVAGILAAGTKRVKKQESHGARATGVAAPSEKEGSTLASPAEKTGGKNVRNMFDPKEWGDIPLEPEGVRDQIPSQVVRTATEEDKKIVVLVNSLCVTHGKNWNELRQQLCCVRRLTRQQVAAIMAEHTRQSKMYTTQAALA